MAEPKNIRTRTRNWWMRNRLGITLAVLMLATLIAYLASNIFISIHPGEVGVQWSRFFGGTKTDKAYGEGIHVILPWNIMYKYNVRFQQRSASFDVLSSDGLRMETVITVRFKPVISNVPLLHKIVGPEYVETLLIPEVGFNARERIAQYTPEEFYSARRFDIQYEIMDRIRSEAKIQLGVENFEMADFLFVENVFIESVTLPEQVAGAIRDKLSQLQHLEEYTYIVARELKEKERKIIEAEGIRAFQDIVREGISDRYLKWKGIDATLRLALSNNAKIVVIGAGEGGLPIILGNLEGSGSSEDLLTRAEELQLLEPTVPSEPGLQVRDTTQAP